MARTRTVTIEARRRPAAAKPPLAGNRGWLLVYIICLAIELVHGLGLTVAALIIYGNPSLAGLHSFVPLWALLVYVVTNIALVAYGVVVLVLMAKKRKAAIINNIAFNILSVAVVVCWHFIGAKSHLGTILDSLPDSSASHTSAAQEELGTPSRPSARRASQRLRPLRQANSEPSRHPGPGHTPPPCHSGHRTLTGD